MDRVRTDEFKVGYNTVKKVVDIVNDKSTEVV